MSNDKRITELLVEESPRLTYTNLHGDADSLPNKDWARTKTRSSDLSLDTENPFRDPDVAARYALLYEKAQYECRHVFDPTMTWTPAEEKKLVRKLDWHVCLWAVGSPNSLSDPDSLMAN